jgi:MoaA/NifB/PqqE/SkfB family radical SAM enzyme
MKHVLLDITTACAAKCKYCLHQYRNMVKPRAMTQDHFVEITRILVAEKYNYVFPYMSGESMRHPRYWPWMLAMSRAGIMTNTASKLCFEINSADVVNCFANLEAPMHFDITIDAPNQSIQGSIAKNIDNDLVFKNLAMFVSLSCASPVSISVVTVVNKYNQDHLPEISRRIRSAGAETWAPKPMGYYMGYRMQPQDEAMIVEMAPSKSSRFAIVGGHVASKMKSCGKFLKPVIGPAGDVTICCHDMLYHEVVGNVLKAGSLDAVVKSTAYREKVELGKKMKLEICRGCN